MANPIKLGGRTLQECLQILDNAIERAALVPYATEARKALEMLKLSRERIPKEDAFLKKIYKGSLLPSYPEASQRALKKLNEYIPELENRVVIFKNMRDYLSQHIQLAALPNEDLDGERIYLARGMLIMPAGKNPVGYFVFKISISENRHVELEQTSSYRIDSIDEAIEKCKSMNMVGTIAIAKNTEHYPIEETALPIIKEKYERAFGL